MQTLPPPLQRDLVLVGGGHAHALALRMLAMRPIAGLRITLVSLSSHTPYSGMLPGLIAGHYTFTDTHIDLDRLCRWANVRFIAAEVVGIDPQARRIRLRDRPDLHYDILSLDTGSEPELDSVPGARAHATPVKPVHQLWQRWQAFAGQTQGPVRVTIVGGGAGGVEIAMAMATGLRASRPDLTVAFSLLCGGPNILAGYNGRARAQVERALGDAGIELRCNARVTQVEAGSLQLGNASRHDFDQLFWCTGASPGRFLADSGLPVDDRGFLAVRDTLQSTGFDNVFGAGDIATQLAHPRPKAGVYAVRQGPVLAHNLLAFAQGVRLREHRPQQRFLSLVSLGGRRAVADRSVFSAVGAWVWRWKDRIDREFMNRFVELPAMHAVPVGALPELSIDEPAPCGGCGAKVGADALSNALAALRQRYPDSAPGPTEDAAQLNIDAPFVLQSVDMLRQLVSDPFLMGRIAVQHALSDLFAMDARPHSALAIVSLPFASGSLLQRDLEQLLAGALEELQRHGARLAGGHSMQGAEFSVGFCVNGLPPRAGAQPLPKQGLQGDECLILTQALGSGVLFAGAMRGVTDGRELEAAVQGMLLSNARAGELARQFGASAVTDVTGFGLLGHLLEILGDCGARLQPDAPRAVAGADRLLADGIRGSAHADNLARVKPRFDSSPPPLWCDAQTGGGLLIAVLAEQADALLAALLEAGYADSRLIGRVDASDDRVRFSV